MERLTRREPFWLGEEFWTSAMEPDDEEIDAVYEKLKHYEDLEERLEKVYVEHERMLETIVSNLEKHEGIDVGNPGKALLLTDDDVDKWNEYSKIGTVEEVMESVNKRNKKKPVKKINENDIALGHIIFKAGTKTYWCPECGKIVSRGWKYCSSCGQKIDWSVEE